MDTELLGRIDRIIRREIVAATGCTEPACIALAVAYASALISSESLPESIDVYLSPNMLKNAMGVGIPGTGMIGIPIAIALGALLKAPEKQLDLLNDFTQTELSAAKEYLSEASIGIYLKEGNTIEKLYVEVLILSKEGDVSRSIISGEHTNLVLLELNGERVDIPAADVDASVEVNQSTGGAEEILFLDFDLVYRYALEAPLEQLEFIYEAAQKNKVLSEYAKNNKYGHSLGRVVKSDKGKHYLGISPMISMIAQTSGACDARMDGVQLSVMSNSGSGNQGISAMLPVLTFAEEEGIDYEKTVRALIMSNLLVIYVKQCLGRLSGLCGTVISGLGTTAAVVYMMGGSREQSGYAIHNMIGNVAGMICDGAKPSCSLKVSTSVSSAMLSALLAIENTRVSAMEGIVESSVDASIRNLAVLGREAMLETDRKVLEMMTNKRSVKP